MRWAALLLSGILTMATFSPEQLARALMMQDAAAQSASPAGSSRLPPPPGLAELKAMYANGMITREEFDDEVATLLPENPYPAARQDVPLPADQMPSGKRFKPRY